MLIWLNENLGFHPSFSRHGITRASSVLLIWLNENVPIWESETTFFHLHPLCAIVKKMLLLCISLHFVVVIPPNSDWSLQIGIRR